VFVEEAGKLVMTLISSRTVARLLAPRKFGAIACRIVRAGGLCPRLDVRRIAERHGFGRVHAKRAGKWVADYLAKYLSKKVRAACLKGKRLWATFGDATWCRVKDIQARTWLGDEYRRLRAGAVGITRKQSYAILQQALRNFAVWVDSASGVTVWSPGPSPEPDLGNPR
jgi:hypothetical protein